MSIKTRQAEVLACIAEGMTEKQVGDALGISVGTVKLHAAGARHRLRTKTSAQAARLWGMEATKARANSILLARLAELLGWARAQA